MSRKPPLRVRFIVAIAALALAGCNANQEVNPSSRTAPGSSQAPTFRATIRMTPPNMGRQAAFTPAVAEAVDAAGRRNPTSFWTRAAGRRACVRIHRLLKSIQVSANKRV